MTTLRIEHAISDYDLWKSAFDRLAERRQQAGVRRAAIRRPIDDPDYLMLDLEFDTPAAASTFAAFLEQRVWTSATAAPALAGVPRTRILDLLATEPD
jgi:branched-subunit amino acid aminotransferase/4-amino-4-deoxychorismate lyase